jgi:hypothetical protein
MRLTKNDMARVVVMALYNSDKLPARDNVNVVRLARKRKEHLEESYDLAHKLLAERGRAN